MKKVKKDHSQVLVLNVKVLPKEELVTAMLKLKIKIMQVVLTLGSMTAILLEMCPHRPAQVVLVPEVLTQESELSAKDSLRRRSIALLKRNLRIKITREVLMLGLITVILTEMCLPRPVQVAPVLEVPTQESELSAKDSPKRRSIVLPNTRVTPMLGLMTVILLEMYLHRPAQVVLEPEVLTEESASNAKASLKKRALTDTNLNTKSTISFNITQETAPMICQTATELMEPQVLTAATSEETFS